MKKVTNLRAIVLAGVIALCTSFGTSLVNAAEYSALASMNTQVAVKADTGYPIVMAGESTRVFKLDGSKITIQSEGDFYFSAAAQIGSAGEAIGSVYLWVRVNGKDVEDSNSVQSVTSPKFTAVLVSQGGITLKKGDVLEFIYAGTAPGLGLIATRPAGMPGVPSIIFTIYQL